MMFMEKETFNLHSIWTYGKRLKDFSGAQKNILKSGSGSGETCLEPVLEKDLYSGEPLNVFEQKS